MIKNIILDVGGVLFDDGKQKFTKILNMDIKEVTRICNIAFGKNFKQCMLGNTSIIEYIKEYETNADYELLNYVLNPKYYDTTFPIIKETVDYIYQLKDKGYRLYLLTNITDGSYAYINEKLNIKDLFDGGVYSFQEHMIKPDHDFYNLLIQRYNLNKEECIFFDDVEENVNTGNEIGIRSIKYNSIEDIKSNLE